MPVIVDPSLPDHHLFGKELALGQNARVSDFVDIGLINNMPDSALISTERQVFNLLNAAAGELGVRLHLYALDTTPRTLWGRDYLNRFYSGVNDLLNSRLDGIVVTGAEPSADSLREEPYWASFAQVIDWARENTHSSICSCLAVHGAVLHLDGVKRHPLPSKCIGVFVQNKAMDHPLMLDVPEQIEIPHSRWNEVREVALTESGYSVLTKSTEIGVDCFVKQHQRSLFVFFQGHPEYEARSLLGEFRRDIGRFLRGENETYPTMPQGYFSPIAEEKLVGFERAAKSVRRAELLADLPIDQLSHDLRNTWCPAAERIYRNWILYLSSQKARQSKMVAVNTLT